MRLNIVRSKNSSSFYVVKTVYVDGKQTTKVVEKIGTLNEIIERIGKDKDPYKWAKEYVSSLNEKEMQEKREIIARFSPTRQIPTGEQHLYDGGYLFLQKIYHELGLDSICKTIEKKYRFKYDLNAILSRLIYGRILFPSSKRMTYEMSSELFERPNFDLHQIYRALEILTKETDYIESSLYKNSIKQAKRKTGVLYYDCTNYYFEMERAEGIKQYGYSKEHRPNPIVQMGLFMDAEGIPLAFSIFEGNKNEQQSLTPLEKQIISDFGLSKFVVCTDAGLGSMDNRIFNSLEDRAFVVTQSLKTLKTHLIEWSLSPSGWSVDGDNKEYDLSALDENDYRDTTFYKERWLNENNIQQRFIVTFSFKYRRYQRQIRQNQIDSAKKKIMTPSKVTKRGSNDPNRFIKSTSFTENGELAVRQHLMIDQSVVEHEERFDGFYGVCTNLEDDVCTILSVNQRRWEIEECFRIMKSELQARPVYLSRDDRIKAHFLTCFLALIIFRHLEKKLSFSFTCDRIITTLRDMKFFDLHGDGFSPAYTRTDITDALHDVFGFRTDFEVLNNSKLKAIIKLTHSG